MSRENVVEMTTMVDLTGQLSNLREALRGLLETFSSL